jgi:ribonucleoside-triphosphate reductase
MDLGLKALSDITTFSKYAKYLPQEKTRENWDQIVDRYENMLIKKYPKLEKMIRESVIFIREKKVLPSMRALQFAGPAAEVNNARIYNCCYLPIDSLYSFSETMYLLLGGTGVGYSVQSHHINQLPTITTPGKKRNYLIEDSIMGWADAIKVLMKAYLEGSFMPSFDFRSIRHKGARLVTAGGKAPGPEPLKLCLAHIQAILDRKNAGEHLSPLECHDILCHIANSVLAGGIRRSAMIALFDFDDEEMVTCKYGSWWETNEQRGRANNSAVLVRGTITEKEFIDLWKRIEASGSGEPGTFWTNNKDWGTNPCCEIGLRPYQFCNLCEVNVSDVVSQEDLNDRVTAATFFGTLQAGFTDFHYLRPIWQKTTQKDALLGIGMTGIGSGAVLNYNLSAAANIAKMTNQLITEMTGINEAARITCIKPGGTTSCVLGTSSGIHAWYAPYYLRTMRFNKNEAIAQYLMIYHSEMCEDDILRPTDTVCVRIPIKAPEGAILRTETAIDTLERVKKFSKEWIQVGHVRGDNSHNVSATISIDKNRKYYSTDLDYNEEKGDVDWEWRNLPELYGKTPSVSDDITYSGVLNEWEAAVGWMWENRDHYNGLSVLDYDGGSYTQAPFEEITKEEYERRIVMLKSLDLSKVVELDDNVEFGAIAACAGGACELI